MANEGESIRIRGLVQGVGFRPTVWRIAGELDLTGDVRNDGDGVLVNAWGRSGSLDRFCERIQAECPPLARIDSIARVALEGERSEGGFAIRASAATAVRTGIVPDAATCEACRGEIFDSRNRRFRYPFTNCTHCGPRLSIVHGIPYDRANTSMAVFPLCAPCEREYGDPADRRFHAQPNACADCGPRLWLQDGGGQTVDPAALGARDAVQAAGRLLAEGRILGIKGIGGFHLACDASNALVVKELRRRKRRNHKPFALMVRDAAVLRRYAVLDEQRLALLSDPAAPIVILEPLPGAPPLPADIAPGQRGLGFMLPYSPLHHLLLSDWEEEGHGGPLVMTSGNLSDEPQCLANDEAGQRLGDIADYFLLHDRDIVNRVDDSVWRVMDGRVQPLRRARGYAPAPLPLPKGFEAAPPLLAMGGELKNTFCLVRDGQAVLSQHLGDLEDARTADEYARSLDLYRTLFEHRPQVVAVDAHPDYRSTLAGMEMAGREGLELVSVQHHHAHIAAVMADNGWPLEGGPVLGIALDGLGYGLDGTLWGGEFLLADYATFRRLGCLKPVSMPGGVKAILEPWRNTFAHILAHFGWEPFHARWPRLELTTWLSHRPLNTLAAMVEQGISAPLTSSCGRLFDAVAAALGIWRQGLSYEGQAAVELETLAARSPTGVGAYPFDVLDAVDVRQLDPAPLWAALFDDLSHGVENAIIAARFHNGLAAAVVGLAANLAEEHRLGTLALSGGVFQNEILYTAVARGLRTRGFRVLAHHQVPPNDGGLSLGQAAVALACVRNPD